MPLNFGFSGHQFTPLRQSGRAVLLEDVAAIEVPGSQDRAEVSEAHNEALRPTAIDRNRPAQVLRCGTEGHWNQ